MCLCLDAGIIHIKLAGSNKSSGQAGFQHTGAWEKGSQRCGGFDWWHVIDTFFWFLQRICRHRKNRRHRNTGNTEYIHVKDRFLQKNVCWCKYASFPSARFWRSRRSRMMISRVWVRSAGWVCAQFILDISPSAVFMDWTDTVYLFVYIQCFVGAWLALRMPLPSVCSKPAGAESQVFTTESVSELFIHVFYLSNWSLTKREPTLWRIRLMTSDRHFIWFLQRICRHRKNRRHRNAGNTEYIHVKDRFLQKKFADVNMLLFPAPVSEGAEEAGWWDQGCEWGLRVGFVRSLFWSFLIPPFLWIELTPYI